jgi:hypothetical protein
MSVEFHHPPKPKKVITYSGFEPRTSGLAAGSLHHCTIESVLLLHNIQNIFQINNVMGKKFLRINR